MTEPAASQNLAQQEKDISVIRVTVNRLLLISQGVQLSDSRHFTKRATTVSPSVNVQKSVLEDILHFRQIICTYWYVYQWLHYIIHILYMVLVAVLKSN